MLDNHRRIYVLAQWTVEKKARGWYIRRTNYDDEWKGPYRSEISACLTIARQLKKELTKRDGCPA
jgi:hypothetical protein